MPREYLKKAPQIVPSMSGAATYSGGLRPHKFPKLVISRRTTRTGAEPIAKATARLEDIEAHACSAAVRPQKDAPKETFNLTIHG
ncbi:MAG: hypothetical protein QNJ44_23795 [Rhodobacter sp.]|nr:hypothetical protein [Rhodobacter sp.]